VSVCSFWRLPSASSNTVWTVTVHRPQRQAGCGFTCIPAVSGSSLPPLVLSARGLLPAKLPASCCHSIRHSFRILRRLWFDIRHMACHSCGSLCYGGRQEVGFPAVYLLPTHHLWRCRLFLALCYHLPRLTAACHSAWAVWKNGIRHLRYLDAATCVDAAMCSSALHALCLSLSAFCPLWL